MVTPTYTFRLSQHGLDLDQAGQHALGWTSPCRAATTANITIATGLNAGDTIDGVTLAAGDRVLVKNQGTGSQNGIYIVGVSPARAEDYDTSAQIVGSVVVVSEGTANADSTWQCTTNGPITVGTTALVFAAFGGGAASPLADVLAAGNDTAQIAIVYDDLDFDSPAEVDISGPVIISGASLPSGEDGLYVDIVGGVGDGGASGGEIFVDGGEATGTGGNVEILAGAPRPTSDGDGGDVLVTLPAGDGTGRDGQLILGNVPTADPTVTDAIWADGGILVQSGATAGGGGAHDTTHQDGGADEIDITGLAGIPAELATHLADAADAHDASAVSFAPAAGIAATDVQAAIVEDAGDLAAHIADATAAHAASAIAFTPNGSIAATDVQAAIQEVRDEAGGGGAHATSHQDGGADEISIAGLDGTPVELTNHLNDAADAHDASAISFTPTGTIAATDVQAAIAEVAAEAAGGHTEDHDHDGSPTQKLLQANTHESPDTDTGPTSLHHTLGAGANQAAAGNHAHAPDVQLFDTAGNTTWTKPAGAVMVEVVCVGGGGGGGAGRKGAASSARFGGGGGGGGGMSRRLFLESELAATEKLTVGALGTGASSVSASDTNGGAGGSGGSSYFGNSADGVIADAKISGSGGGAGYAGDATSSFGARPGLGNVASAVWLVADATTNANSMYSGGYSLLGASATGGVGLYSCGGGGGGGAVDASNNERAGGAGIYPAARAGTTFAAGGAVHAVGTAGTTITNTGDLGYGGFGGGGGGGSKTAANVGTGGAGGFPGGGGGGGGAGVNSVVNSGGGGAGSKGAVWVISYFA